jgi:hypothetical protein
MTKRLLLAICLGAPAAFSLAPVPALAASAMSLSDVRKIYIEKMDNNLDQYLSAAISKEFHGTVTVVLNRSGADAILRGLNTRAQNTTEANVQLVDPSGSVVLWSGSASDRNPMSLDIQHGGQMKIANKLAKQLKKAMQP